MDEVLDRVQSRKIGDNARDLVERTVDHLRRNGVATDKQQLTHGPWLDFDPNKEQYVGNAAADAMLTREYRQPFVVPAESEV